MKAESFGGLNLNAYTDLDNRERATARDKKKNKGDEFFNRGRISSVGIALYSCILQSGRSRVRFPEPKQYSGSQNNLEIKLLPLQCNRLEMDVTWMTT